jgi:hypothetical protein
MSSNERFVRWQAVLREHLSYAINLFLTFSVAIGLRLQSCLVCGTPCLERGNQSHIWGDYHNYVVSDRESARLDTWLLSALLTTWPWRRHLGIPHDEHDAASFSKNSLS